MMASQRTGSRTEDVVISTTSEIFPDAIIDMVLRDIRNGPELLLWTYKKLFIAPRSCALPL